MHNIHLILHPLNLFSAGAPVITYHRRQSTIENLISAQLRWLLCFHHRPKVG